MKNILITQGIYKDRKNNFYTKLDLDWFLYAKKMKFNLQPLPINFDLKYLKNYKFEGIIFSGGNDLYSYSKSKENLLRDKLEKKLINFFLKKKIPIMFICRGMQLISSMYNIKLEKTLNHVTRNQKIILKDKKILNVNSYHNYLIRKVPKNFSAVGKSINDNSIEIMIKKSPKILCLMFHPERYSKSQKEVNKIFKSFFKL